MCSSDLIKTSEKEKFIQYCRDSQRICGSNGESIELLCWADNVEIYNKDSYNIVIYTIQERQKEVQRMLDRLDEMKENHYLYRHIDRDWFLKLLDYKWL